MTNTTSDQVLYNLPSFFFDYKFMLTAYDAHRRVTNSSDEVGSARRRRGDQQGLTWHITTGTKHSRMATQESKSSLVAPILMATPTVVPDGSASRARIGYAGARLTSLQHLVTSLADDVQTDDLLVGSLTDQLVRRRLLVLFLEHGERHGLELEVSIIPISQISLECKSDWDSR